MVVHIKILKFSFKFAYFLFSYSVVITRPHSLAEVLHMVAFCLAHAGHTSDQT